jgi:hypothetical protein
MASDGGPVRVNWSEKHTRQAAHHVATVQINSGFSGRWDRNRTGALQLWSLLPYIQGRSGTFRNVHEAAESGPF